MPKILTQLRIDSVAAVDKGAGENVRVVFMKRFAEPDESFEDLVQKAWADFCVKGAALPIADFAKSHAIDAAVAADIFKAVDQVDAYLKRQFSDDKRQQMAAAGTALPSGGYPIENEEDLRNAIRAYGRASAGERGQVKAHIMRRARALGRADLIPDKWKDGKKTSKRGAISKALAWLGIAKDAITFDQAAANEEVAEYADGMMQELHEAKCALRMCVDSILCDDTVADKKTAIDEAFDAFTAHVEAMVPEGMEDAMAAATLVATGFTITPAGTVEKRVMTDAEKAAEAKKVKDAEDAKEKAEKRFQAVLKMSGAHSAYMNHEDATMPDGGKEAFADMSADERDKHIEKHPLKEKAEKRFAALPEDVRKKLAEAEQTSARLAKLEKADALARFEKRAVEIGLPSTDAELLMKAHAGDGDAVTKLEDKVLALTNQVKAAGLFKEIGGKGGQEQVTAKAEFDAKVAELMKADPKLTVAKATAQIASSRDPAMQKMFKAYRAETEGPGQQAA